MEGPAAVNVDDQISFIAAMCETGGSARYAYRPRDRASQEFADLVAEYARRQFEDSRQVLDDVERGLRTFARTILMEQVNELTTSGRVENVVTRFAGQWEWCIELQRADERPTIFLEFGPPAVVENERVPQPLSAPDYSRVFVTIHAADGENIERIVQTDVSLADVLNGLTSDDERLRNVVLAVAAAS